MTFESKRIKPAQVYPERASINNPGDFLLSHTVSHAVPSAPAGLTSVFGMGTGVTLPTKSPENRCDFGFRNSNQKSELRKNFFGSGDPAVRRAKPFPTRTANRPESALRNLKKKIE